jgi:two-component system, NtrC family, nitrogen regulation sensor histidine kinase NtrY
MSFRARLLLMFTVTVVAVVATVGAVVSISTRRAFERADEQHTAALVGQIRGEISRRGTDITRDIDSIASRDALARIAAAAGQPNPDTSPYVNEAGTLASDYRLEFLELVAADGTIISSAQWPARFGYKDESFPRDPNALQAAFLKSEELPSGPVLALSSVRPVRAAGGTIYVIGGRRIDNSFLASLSVPSGTHLMLWKAGRGELIANEPEPLRNAAHYQPLIALARNLRRDSSAIVYQTSDPADSESVHALPLLAPDGNVLAILLVANSRRDVIALERNIRTTALGVGIAGVLLGLLLSGWLGARITRPVQQLAEAARSVSAGNLDVRLDVPSGDELGDLADAFDHMTRDLIDHRDRLVQAERVAAWRELARRLAHELKNPLFPLQLTVENLIRTRELAADQFDEVFRESTATLLQELATMKAIIGRFSDFSKMPSPQLRPLQMNEIAAQVAKLVEPQLARPEGNISAKLDLAPDLPLIAADRELLYRAVQNLALNAIDAMPRGGTLTLRTRADGHVVRLDVADTGEGLTPEERERLFTPYYTTKEHGTGLGLAIVQSIVSDHHGKVWVDSDPGRGATFHIELPIAGATLATQGMHV